MLAGLDDPFGLLKLDPDDAQIAAVVIERTLEERRRYDESMAAAIGAEVANKLLPPLTRSLGSLIESMLRAMPR